MNRLGASAGPAIIVAYLVGVGKMTLLDGVLVGIIVLVIGWVATPFGKPIRKEIEDWLYGSADSKQEKGDREAIHQATKPITKTSEEIENERFHNRRKGSLKIEFSNDYSFKSIGPLEGHGIGAGNLQTYRVAVHNTTEQDISGVQVWLENITPMPPELMGHGAIPLHITHEAQGVNVITLRAHEKRYVDVVSFFDKFWNCKIRIEHTSAVVEREVFVGVDGGEDDGYNIELAAKRDKVERFSRRFEIGVRNRELYMVSLDQPAEEAFAEGFRDA